MYLNRPNPPKQKLDNLNFLKTAFSKARIQKYLEAVCCQQEVNDECMNKAVQLYQINMKYCESLYPSLHTLEISLRNYIDQNLSNKYHSNWFFCETDYFQKSMNHVEEKYNKKYNLNVIRPENSTKILLTYEQEKVICSIDDIIKSACEKYGNKQCVSCITFNVNDYRDKIIANLGLGFWITLLTQTKRGNCNYLHKIFIPCVKDIFPNAKNVDRSRSTIQPILTGIKNLRNRVFHHEPIIWDYYDIKQKYDNIYKVLNWIDPSLEVWLKYNTKIDRFPDLHRKYSEEIKNLMRRDTKIKIKYEDRSNKE
ncbi:MAG: hypothetical protein QNJ49_16930 [Mastigocoleus sp. MO_167.B18]|nr:hypothetical protein [Mastigocoleus sp. MO_167.B18]